MENTPYTPDPQQSDEMSLFLANLLENTKKK